MVICAALLLAVVGMDGPSGGASSTDVSVEDAPMLDANATTTLAEAEDDSAVLQVPTGQASDDTSIQDMLLEVPSFPKYRSDFMNSLPKDIVPEFEEEESRSVVEPDDSSFKPQRINHASHKANAAILSHNPEATGATSLLGGDSDHYYMTPCTAPKKWVVISLSEDVSVWVFTRCLGWGFADRACCSAVVSFSSFFLCSAVTARPWRSLPAPPRACMHSHSHA